MFFVLGDETRRVNVKFLPALQDKRIETPGFPGSGEEAWGGGKQAALTL
jgi:hypothetical protein